MAKQTWGWETHDVNILSLNAVPPVWIDSNDVTNTNCVCTMLSDICILLFSVHNKVFITPGAFCLSC